MVLSNKAYSTNTTYSKWEKGDIKRIYLNSPILRWFNVKIYYDKGASDHRRVNQIGKLSELNRFKVLDNFDKYLMKKGIVKPDIPGRMTFCDTEFEKFEDFWNKL